MNRLFIDPFRVSVFSVTTSIPPRSQAVVNPTDELIALKRTDELQSPTQQYKLCQRKREVTWSLQVSVLELDSIGEATGLNFTSANFEHRWGVVVSHRVRQCIVFLTEVEQRRRGRAIKVVHRAALKVRGRGDLLDHPLLLGVEGNAAANHLIEDGSHILAEFEVTGTGLRWFKDLIRAGSAAVAGRQPLFPLVADFGLRVQESHRPRQDN